MDDTFSFHGPDGWTWYGQEVGSDTIHACGEAHAEAQEMDIVNAKTWPCYYSSVNDGNPYNEDTERYDPDNVYCGACVDEEVEQHRHARS